MGSHRLGPVAEGVVLLAVATAASCAADNGDPLKTAEDGATAADGTNGGSGGSGDDGASSGGGDATASGSGSSSGGSSSGGGGTTSASSGSPSSSGADASGRASDGAGGPDATPLVDGAACLMDTGACPVCATQNASDAPKCMEYLTCYENNGCNPHTSCGAMDAVCGVNTVGGGNAPQAAAIATYDCACH